jgi:transposase-like protein/rubredoxin
MQEIITQLLVLIQYQARVITALRFLYFGKAHKPPKPEKCTDKKHMKLAVDPLPVFGKPGIEKIYDCDELIKSKNIKPIKHRGKNKVPSDVVCPYCGASREYLYDNTGGRGQFECKVCKSLFHKVKPSRDDEPHCPFCGTKLSHIKSRKTFDVFRCNHKDCSYRRKRISSMTAEQKKIYKHSPHIFKLRFIYRKFHFDFTPLSKQNGYVNFADLPKITASSHVLGLILTYNVNYGIPLRKTSALMYDVHGVKISHQTVANYKSAVALRVKPFVDHYPYELSDQICGDETYIKIKGIWNYIFFFFDATKKIILSYRVRKNRDYQSAILAINDVLVKFKEIPKKLNLITDGNPIYLLARHFFAQYGMNFDIAQVIGLTNDDPVSAEFRPLKQIIERLNRTFKGNYKPTTGCAADFGAISSVTLFVACYNFLRPHETLKGNVPVALTELENLPNMPAKWLKLIKMSENFVISQSG